MAVQGKKPRRQRVQVAQGMTQTGLGPLIDSVAAEPGAQAVVVVYAVDKERLVKGTNGLPAGQVQKGSTLNQEVNRARSSSAATLVEVVRA